MKIDTTTRQQMKSNIKTVALFIAEQKGIDLNTIEFTTGLMHQLWFIAFSNVAYDSENPNVFKVAGNRLIPFNPEYSLYPCGSNDSTIETALKSIFAEIKNEL